MFAPGAKQKVPGRRGELVLLVRSRRVNGLGRDDSLHARQSHEPQTAS